MCGISLLVNTKTNYIDESWIRDMNNKVIHRGPDDEGYYYGKNFALGHRRLSVIDLSYAGHQPMNRDNYSITYNGEIYNYLELIEELKELGHIFKTHSDTEVIFPAYWEWGIEAFHKFNGMWAFILYDAAKQEIILCRDRFGVKPLFYTTVGDLFMAGSEIKQFTVFDAFKPVLNKKVAINFLTKGYLNYNDETFFEGVHALKPGHFMIYDLRTNKTKIHKWYDLRKRVKPTKDKEEKATQKIHDLLSDSINLRMRADVRVGSCLSGGLDSSSIVSLIHQHKFTNGSFATFTSCYQNKEYDEQEYSDIISKQTGYKSIKVFPELDDLLDENHFDKIIYHHDQPFSTASHYSEFSVFKAARQNNMTVLMDGQGADEYFFGYEDFFTNYISEMVRTGRWHTAWRLLLDKANIKNTGAREEWKEYLRTIFWHPLQKNVKAAIAKSDFPWLNSNWKRIAATRLKKFNEKNLRRFSIQQVKHSSLPYQLHSADRNSMMFSLEVREPFMDYRLVEYTIGLPASYKIQKGYSKHILRQAITVMPERVKFRKDKMGFVAPEIPWIIQNKERVREELKEAIANTGVFSEQLVTRFDKFISGKLGYESIYFRAITFNRFCKIFKLKID